MMLLSMIATVGSRNLTTVQSKASILAGMVRHTKNVRRKRASGGCLVISNVAKWPLMRAVPEDGSHILQHIQQMVKR
jgi:hypothetical protein